MDQNNQQDSIFMAPPVQKNAKYYRNIALQKLKPFWLIAIAVALLASLLCGTGQSINLDFKSNNSNELSPTQIERVMELIVEGKLDTVIDAIVQRYPLVTFLMQFAVAIVIGAVLFAIAFTLFVAAPVKVGYRRFHLEIYDGNEKEIRVGTLFRFFKEGYLKTVGLNALHTLIMLATYIPTLIAGMFGVSFIISQIPLVTSLWEVFLAIGIGMAFFGIGAIVTGVIEIPLSYMYGFAHMIMADHPDISPVDALRSSRTLMKGYKWRLFCLDLSFIGWYFLGMLCFGIGVFAVLPYHHTARAAFYHDIAGRAAANETEFPSLDPDDYKIEE